MFDSITSGASNDIEKATQMVTRMVRRYGMSRMGFRMYGNDEKNVFLGRDITEHSKDYSDDLAHQIDEEINGILSQCYEDGKRILIEHKTQLTMISKILREREVLSFEDLDALMKTGQLPPALDEGISPSAPPPPAAMANSAADEETGFRPSLPGFEPPLHGSRA